MVFTDDEHERLSRMRNGMPGTNAPALTFLAEMLLKMELYLERKEGEEHERHRAAGY